MLELVFAAGVGFLAARLVWLLARPLFNQQVFARPNYRGYTLPTAAGAVLPVAVILVEAGRAVAGALGVGDTVGLDGPRAFTLLAALGFGLLGLVDDLAGDSEHRGFRGHVIALSTGRVTTGLFKLIGGAAVALVAVAPIVGDSGGRLLADAALVALAANLGNLFDRAPGRTLKTSCLSLLVLAIAAGTPSILSGTAVVVGAGLGLFLDDLHEHLMLGDAGANVLGAVLGLGAVLALGPGARTVVLVIVGGLNLLGEVVSFSRVIDAVPPLRALDRAGRRP